MRSYRVKLKVTNKKQRETLKAMAGAYRAIFNSAIDLQQDVLHFNSSKGRKSLVSGTDLYNHFRERAPRKFPFLASLDRGLLSAACFHASTSFKRWWDNYSSESKYRQPKHLAKRDLMTFKTDGNVKVFYDRINVPKLGEIKLFEKGYIPQGKKYMNITFSYDGNDWFLCLEVLEKEHPLKQKLTGAPVVLDFNKEGDLIVGNTVISSVVTSTSYQNEMKKYKQLAKKLRRQKRANLELTNRGIREVRTSRNMLKTKAKMAKAQVRMENIRKDQFKKVASVVAIAKPKKLLVLSKEAMGRERQGGLSRVMREKHILDFINIISKKLELIGTQIVRHKSFVRFKNAASGLGVVACGELMSSHAGETINSLKQELCAA